MYVCVYVSVYVSVCLILCAGFFGCICFLCRFICIPFCAASRFMFCVFSLFHYLVYLSLLMTFKWHLLSARNAGGREGRENKESGRRRGERAMNGNRKATHTQTYNSISRASKFVESCCQATNLSNSICELPH